LSAGPDFEQPGESALDLYENAPCGYLSTDPDGTIRRVNRTFLDWTGYRAADLVGVKRFQDLLSAGGRIYHETHYAPLLRMQGAVREIAVDIVRRDGRRLPTLVNSVLQRDADGAPEGVRTTIFDATDRRRYERELLAARDRERLAREQIERLQRLSSELAGASDTGGIARAVVGQLVAVLGPARAAFATRGDTGETPRVVLRHGDAGLPPSGDPPAEPLFDEGDPPVRDAAVVAGIGGAHARGVLWAEFDGARRFTPDERALVVACARQATVALERARLYEAQRDVAHVLQRSMLPGGPPDDPRLDVAALYNPAGEHLEVGGDWYDWFAVAGGNVGIVVGDVVGRGLQAASAMGQLRSAVRALAAARLSPADILTHLDAFVEQIPAAQYATLAYVEVDPGTGRACFASAGHLPALLVGGSDAPCWVMEGRSQPLGVAFPGAAREQAAVELPPGQGFLLYTDGLVERRGEAIDAGLERLSAAVRAQGAPHPSALVGHLAAALAEEGADDDVCLLCLVRRRAR
jgi:PAS domain S-box-containing protein